jgi:Domain of unknown function DUF29
VEELLDLRIAIEEGRYDDALLLVEDMNDMAKKSIIDTIGSFIQVLLIHLIKQDVEQRMTRSWLGSIIYSAGNIQKRNRRNKSNGTYMNENDLSAAIDEYFESARRLASLEAFDGKYSPREFAALVDAEAVKAKALDYILNGVPDSEDES